VTAAAESGSAPPSARIRPRRAPRRRRLLRFAAIAHAVTAVGHVPFALLLARWLGPLGGAVAGVLVWLAVSVRLHQTAFDRRRPAWQVALLDVPIFWHWGACIVSVPLVILGLPGLALFPIALHELLAAAWAGGALVSAWSIAGRRRWLKVRRIELPMAGLGPELDGYRIVQLSDLHVGSFDGERRAAEWVARANALAPDVVAVTGDLVTAGTHFYGDAARALGGLRARDGCFVVLGNHDQWDPDALERALSEQGLRVLRNAWMLIERGGSAIVVAGVDDGWSRRDDLDRALAGRPAATPTVLLAHHPTLLERAAAAGVDLVLCGHTHGGQVGMPFVADALNVASLAGQHARGVYGLGRTRMVVHAGLGTTGPPMRLGVAPEIVVVVLRAARTS
jgi:hypothetical protein